MRIHLIALTALILGCNSTSESVEQSESSPRNALPVEASTALRDGDSFELLSLDPTHGADDSDGEKFHHWRVLGVARIEKAAVRTDLLNAFDAGVAANDGTVAACFNPRHGIRVIHDGNLYEFVICFECYSAKWFKNGVRNHGFLTTELPQPKFDRVLRDAGIQLPEPAR